MAKKTLKSALRAHEARKSQAQHAKKVEEALHRKEQSVKLAAAKASVKNRARASGPSKAHPSSAARPVKKTSTRMFETDDTILLVGEGNFSFARSLLLPPHNHSPLRILATAFDTESECYAKYPDAAEYVAEMRKLAGRDEIVAFGVDAGNLLSSKVVKKKSADLSATSAPASWSKIVFNFPHVGAGHKDERRNVLSNQLLILRFLISSAQLLSRGPLPEEVRRQLYGKTNDKGRDGSPDEDEGDEMEQDRPLDDEQPRVVTPTRAGSILVSLRNCKPYTLWDVPALAKRMTSMWNPIAQTAPAPAKGQPLPTATDVARVVELGQGKSYRVWRSFEFDPAVWPGYSHRRTIGWREGLSKEDNEEILRDKDGECRTWQLGLSD